MVSDPVGLILRVMAGKNITREDLVPEVGSRSALDRVFCRHRKMDLAIAFTGW
jgi:antitoxin component HigA of HigAB toxin-antitoxin module